MSASPVLTEYPIPQVPHWHVPGTAQGTIIYIHRNTRLMRGQRSPMTKGKIESVFARLERLGLGKNDQVVADAQESIRRADLFA